jgi:hypothetical protein
MPCSTACCWPNAPNYTELGRLDAESGFDSRAWEDAIEDFYDEYGDLLIVDQKARGREYIDIEPGSHTWSVRQILADPEDNRDWAIDAEVDVAASDEAGDIVLRIVSVGEIGRSVSTGQATWARRSTPRIQQCQCRVIQWSGDENQ